MRQDLVEPESITLEEAVEIFLGGGNIVMFEKFADEADVGAAGEFLEKIFATTKFWSSAIRLLTFGADAPSMRRFWQSPPAARRWMN